MKSLFEYILIGFIICFPLLVQTGDDPQFKRCEDSGFCHRNRQYRISQQNKKLQYYYFIDPSSVKFDGNEITGFINYASANDFQLKFSIHVYKGGILRMIIDEVKIQNHKRFKTSTVAGFESANLELDTIKILNIDDDNMIFTAPSQYSNKNIFSQNRQDAEEYKFDIQFHPFQLTGYLNEKEAFIINKNNFLSFEKERCTQEQEQLFSKVSIDATYQVLPKYSSKNNIFEETFDGFTDKMIFGPRAITLDFELHTPYLYGLPEHAADFELHDTLFIPNEDPYRLYNIDLFKYELNSTQALYGSIPFLLGHNPYNGGINVGVYWLNAAETWVDLFTPPESINQRGSYWMSETGIMEFFVMMGNSPQSVIQKFADITGHAQLPQYFALGYHQSKWNYKSGEEVTELNKQFNKHEIPLDVVWLDIDHKEYFTWHPNGFSMESLEVMYKELEINNRKLVAIQDPHIHKNWEYTIYQYILEFEELEYERQQNNLLPSTGKYLVRRPNREDIFTGKCWPGESVWLDFLQNKVRTFWGSLYDYQVYAGSKNIMYAWNDMNEPSVFEQAEITMPKGAMQIHIFTKCQIYSHYTDEGIMVENREIHNIYGQLMHKSTFMGLFSRNADYNDRPFVLSRAFFAGSQQYNHHNLNYFNVRYGAVWTGDNMASYDQMKLSVQMLLSLSISGLGFVGADIGGFYGNPSSTLLAKWHQLGMFYPFMRQHSHQANEKREPYLQEGEAFNLIKQSIKIRQQLIPYIYTKFYEQHKYGIPVMRPMFLEFPLNEDIPRINDQFMFGEAFLVKPDCIDQDIMDIASQSIYLPEGKTWYNVFSNIQSTNSNEDHQMPNMILVFARGGTIIPSRERIRKSALMTLRDPFTLTIYLTNETEQKASGFLYLDDGKSYNYQRLNESKLLKFEYKNDSITCIVIGNGTYYSEYAVLEAINIVGFKNQALLKNKVKIIQPVSQISQKVEAEIIKYDKQSLVVIKWPKVPLTMSEGETWEIKLEFE